MGTRFVPIEVAHLFLHHCRSSATHRMLEQGVTKETYFHGVAFLLYIRGVMYSSMYVRKEHGIRFLDISVDPHHVLLVLAPGGVLPLGTQ